MVTVYCKKVLLLHHCILGSANLHNYYAFLLYKKYKIPWGPCRPHGILSMGSSAHKVLMLPTPLIYDSKTL